MTTTSNVSSNLNYDNPIELYNTNQNFRYDVNVIRSNIRSGDVSNTISRIPTFKIAETTMANSSEITVQAIDSLGQKFNEGGAIIKIFYNGVMNFELLIIMMVPTLQPTSLGQLMKIKL